MDKRPLLIAGGAVAAIASGFALRALLRDPSIRRRLGLAWEDPRLRQSASMSDKYIDISSQDSFPASDPPSFTPNIALGHPN
jgi:hypothetical protein